MHRSLFVLCGLLLFAGPAQAQPGAPVRLDTGWAYRWGDPSPGRTDSLREASLWNPAARPYAPPGTPEDILWLRTRLPDPLPENAVVFAPVILFSFEAYLDGELIHRYGPMETHEAVRFAGYRGHLIRLPPGAPGRMLSFRIYSPHPKFIGLYMPPYLGSEGEVLRLALRQGIDQTIIGLLFLVIGLLSLLVFLRRRSDVHALLPLYFGLFTLCTGLTIVGESFARRLFFPFPVFWYYVTALGFFLFPVGLLGFFEQVVGAGRRSVIRRLWQIHLAFAAAALVLDVTGVVMLPELRKVFFGLLTISVLVMVVGGLVALSRGDREAKAFGAGILVAAVAGLHDTIFLGFEVNLAHPEFAAWGAVVFVGCMGYVLERRFFENLRRLRRYSAELEVQSRQLRKAYDQLGEYSATLEQKVEARTEELRRKNEELAEGNERLAEALRRLKETQEQLVLREKMASLGQLTAGIAHEIKNPLNFVTNFAHLSVELAEELQATLEAHRDRLGPDAAEVEAILADLQHNAEKIHFHGQRADSIIRNMMMHARGSVEAPQPTDLHLLLDEYANLAYHGMRVQHPGFNATLERDYDPAVGTVTLVPQEIGRVLLNLLGNAFYALRERSAGTNGTYTPRVVLRTRRRDDCTEIQVEDNGPGIPEDLLDRVFEPFFTTKPAGSGTGLGLSISYEIVTQRHGGTLAVESREGAGATFILCLPDAAPAGDGSATPAPR